MAAFFNHLSAGSYERAYGLLSADLQAKCTMESLKVIFGESLFVVRDLKCSSKGESEAEATACVIVANRGNSSLVLQQDPQGDMKVYRFQLKKDGTAWKIGSYR